MRVLVCGGCGFDNYLLMQGMLGGMHHDQKIELLIHGGARCYGRSAGPRRNQRMLEEAKPDVVIAFPGGKGTADMMARARKAGVRVIVVMGALPAGRVRGIKTNDGSAMGTLDAAARAVDRSARKIRVLQRSLRRYRAAGSSRLRAG